MSNPAIKAQVKTIARRLSDDFLAGLKAQAPDPDEAAVIVRAMQTIASAPFLGVSRPDVKEALDKAQGQLINIGVAHMIDAQELFNKSVTSAIDKFGPIALHLLLGA